VSETTAAARDLRGPLEPRRDQSIIAPGGTAGRWEQFSLAWVVTRREIRDTLRDWRLVVPITLLTLVFPVILNFAADMTLGFVRQYNASVIGEQAIPFMLLVVGFFPISFSLVIALETFVGEKERKSLEPLLATPLTNTQLYLGKTMAALIPPVSASYLGITVYLASLFLFIDYRPPIILVLQILLLTTAEAVVMVSGAVIISSQTTSVRAANLLASFVILPMAFLVQGEAIIMFWSRYELLWFVLLALVVSDLMLVRMGIRIFSREELLGREIDSLNFRRSWRMLKAYLLDPPGVGLAGAHRQTESAPGSMRLRLARFYRRDVPQLLRMHRAPLAVVLIGLAAALFVGWLYAVRNPLPAGLFDLEGVNREMFDQFEGSGLLPSLSTWGILSHNLRSLLAAGLLAVLSFGSLAVLLLMAPIAVIGFVTVQMAMTGNNPLLFIGTFVLPHGIVELPAAIIATAAAVRLGMSVVSPPPGMTVSQSWLQALAHFIKLFLLVVLPLLVVAAFIEVHVTPQLVVAVYGN
jgi:uncharacterized membrane protein SpoIIM required for sporulation/ABC-type transport system involved in multi-copper enzyme maturation permease subunit